MNGTNLVFSATGGVPYDPVYLLTSTNVALPLTSWTYFATNSFDAGGNASFAPTVTTTEAGRYFRLLVE